MCELLINVVGTIIGGLLLTLVLFIFNELIFPIHNLTGEWNVETHTKEALYNPYKNMNLYYKFHLLQKGNEIIGSGEKIKEKLADGTIQEYVRSKRVLSKVNGYYQRNIFRKSKIFLSIIEEGRERESRTTYILTLNDKKNLIGTFTSTASDSIGNVELTKL